MPLSALKKWKRAKNKNKKKTKKNKNKQKQKQKTEVMDTYWSQSLLENAMDSHMCPFLVVDYFAYMARLSGTVRGIWSTRAACQK